MCSSNGCAAVGTIHFTTIPLITYTLSPLLCLLRPQDTGSDNSSAGVCEGHVRDPQICFDFTKGLCTRGDKCKYSHDIATIVQFNSKEKGICFDYLRNQCHRGLLCRFSHDLSNIAQQCQVRNACALVGLWMRQQ